jgi:hypothetical protein
MVPVTQRTDLADPAAAPRASRCPPPAPRHRLGGLLRPPGDAAEGFVVDWQLTPLGADPPARAAAGVAESTEGIPKPTAQR